MLMGVWWWASGYRSCVWDFPTEKLICLGLGFVEAFIAWGCIWDSRFFLFSLVMWVWVFLWGASCGAGVCRPFSVLIHRHDGFLGVLLVGLFHCIVWGFLCLHSFVRGCMLALLAVLVF